MDPAILSALSALFGSAVGGAASLITALVTQNAQGARELLAAELRKREALYGEYVNECSKLMINALDHTLDNPSTMVVAVAVLNRIRLTASEPVLQASEEARKLIFRGYFAKKISLAEMYSQSQLWHSKIPDPLEAFSAACRVELRSLHRIK